MGDKVGNFSSFFKFSGIHVKAEPEDSPKSWWKIEDQIILTTPVNAKIICDISTAKAEDIAELIEKFAEWNYQKKQMVSPFKTSEELKVAIAESLRK